MKKIVFIADSTADLLGLAQKLNNNFEIIWLTYHKVFYKELKRLNFKKIYFWNLSKKLNNNLFFIKYIQKIFDKFSILLRLKTINGFLEKVKLIDKKEDPLLFIADTFDLLRFYKTKKIKKVYK